MTPEIGPAETGDRAQERGLPAPGRTEEGQRLARAQLEVDARQGIDPAEGLVDPGGAHHHAGPVPDGHARSSPRRSSATEPSERITSNSADGAARA